MKLPIRLIFAAFFLWTFASAAGTPVTVTVNTKAHGPAVSPDFAGVSIFTGTQVGNHRGRPGNLFSGTNVQLITLFKNAGLHHLRLGATGSPASGTENLNHADIDSLFAFAKAADIRVIYSLHFAGGVETAKYVWNHYRQNLDCFAFDNEPDNRLNDDAAAKATGKESYFKSWKEFAKSITDAVPGAKFAGPDAAGRTLVARFLKEEKDCGCLALVTQHTYVGGNSKKKKFDVPHAVEDMLSKEWVTNKYPLLYRSVLKPVEEQGLPFRITELDDYVHGVTNGSDAYVSALWSLDVMHWWAKHGARGINFQNTEWLPTDTFHPDSAGNWQMNPKAYGIRAFDLGSHGWVEPTSLLNEAGLNLTAYAVGNDGNVSITIINKEHGASARAADVQVVSSGLVAKGAEVMLLKAEICDPAAMTGITLGNTTITNNAPWHGEWTPLKVEENGQCTVTVPATSAAIVRISSE